MLSLASAHLIIFLMSLLAALRLFLCARSTLALVGIVVATVPVVFTERVALAIVRGSEADTA